MPPHELYHTESLAFVETRAFWALVSGRPSVWYEASVLHVREFPRCLVT
jgi:hypothetical protein